MHGNRQQDLGVMLQMQNKDYTMKPISICAVVATFNRKAVLNECLKALLSQSRPLDEIILIDSASTDGTEEFIKQSSARCLC